MLSSLLFLASASQSQLALDRFSSFIQRADSLSVDCKVTVVGMPAATGKLRFQRPNRVLFTMTWDTSGYVFSSTERGVVETERETKSYDEWPAQTRLVAPQSRISTTPRFGFPAVLVFGDVRALMPGDAKLSNIGKEQLNGVEVDHVQATFTTERGRGKADAYIDAAGRLLKLSQTLEGAGGSIAYAQEYSNYQINGKLTLASFLTAIPPGFVPRALPADASYLELGEKFPEVTLGKKGGSPTTLAFSGKGSLLAFTTPDCEISSRAAKTLATLRESAKALGYAFVEISGASSASQAKAFSGASDVRFDPSGKAWGTLGVQGTPSLWLVDGKGTLLRYWFGFDPAGAKGLVRGVKDALEGKQEK